MAAARVCVHVLLHPAGRFAHVGLQAQGSSPDEVEGGFRRCACMRWQTAERRSAGARALRRRGVSCAPCRRTAAVRGRRCELSRDVTTCTCKGKRPSRRSGQHALHVCPRSAAGSCPLTLCPLHRHRPTETTPLNKEVDVRARRSASAMKNRLEQCVSKFAARPRLVSRCNPAAAFRLAVVCN